MKIESLVFMISQNFHHFHRTKIIFTLNAMILVSNENECCMMDASWMNDTIWASLNLFYRSDLHFVRSSNTIIQVTS